MGDDKNTDHDCDDGGTLYHRVGAYGTEDR